MPTLSHAHALMPMLSCPRSLMPTLTSLIPTLSHAHALASAMAGRSKHTHRLPSRAPQYD